MLEAAGVPGDAAVRFSLGWTSTVGEIDAAVGVFTEVVAKLRATGGGGVA